jgi:NAD+ synthetase
MRLGIAQTNARVGAVEENLALVLSRIEEARRAKCDLVVFPELALPGYIPLDLLWRRALVERTRAALEEVARASRGIGVVVGGISSRPRREGANRDDPSSVIDGAGRNLENAAFLFEDGHLVGTEAKLALPTFDIFDEKRYFIPGPGAEVLPFRKERLGLSICEDLWVDDGAWAVQASLGATLLVNISGSPFYSGKGEIRLRLAARRAQEAGLPLVYVNRVGGEDEVVFDGGSFVVDARGELLFHAPSFEEGLFVVDLERLRPVPPPADPPLGLVRRAIVLGIRDYVRKNGFSRVIVGLSGGVDSSLVAALAVEALGAGAVAGISLPSEITSKESREDAREVARRLGIELVEIPIEGVVDACRAALPTRPAGVTDENLQARVRGTLWMALANERNALVLVTANKSEIAVGYNTLYGDTAGALAPIGDLYKTEVYRLAETLGDRIPERVKKKPPSAELRPGQRDEDDLPPYPVLDPILFDLIEGGIAGSDLPGRGHPEAAVAETLRRYWRSEYKRRQLPPVVKVSQKAFGIGRRLPITHAHRD